MIRLATPEDEGVFRMLWMEYLEEAAKNPAVDLLPTEKNLEVLVGIFRGYVTAEQRGSVLMAWDGEPQGVIMWGELPTGLDSKYGDFFVGWGTYVRPRHRDTGVSKALREMAALHCKQLGAQRIVGSIPDDNKPSRTGFVSMGAYAVQARPYVLEL